MKRILGLDLGTNSIGWALVEIDNTQKTVKIIGLGARILPMDVGEIGDFEKKGVIKSLAAQRTEKRGARRLNERFILRRDRLHLVLNVLKALPDHYKLEVKLPRSIKEQRNSTNNGGFKNGTEPKLSYKKNKENPKKHDFQFMTSYREMLKDFGVKNTKEQRVPYDWTLYYLRKKALDGGKLNLNELAWILLSYNQKRGYEKTEVVDKSTKDNEIIEELDLKVKNVSEKLQDKEGKNYFEIQLEGNDGLIYKEYTDEQMSFEGDLKEVTKTTKTYEEGDEKEVNFTVTDIYSLIIKDVKYEKTENKNPHQNTIIFTNGWKQVKESKKYITKYKNIINKTYDYIIISKYKKDGSFKERSLKEPDFSEDSSDWTLLKKKTEKEALIFNSKNEYIDDKGDVKNYVSPKIYNTLKEDALKGHRTKIIGGMFQVVDRKFYREELNDIINNQKKYHPKLEDEKLINDCIELLYPNNKNHQKLLKNKKAIEALLVDDILLYQRPLKSKKGEIANCKYEIKYWTEEIDKNTGEITEKPYYKKVVSTTHPLFQEFRIWNKIHNLKLIKKEKKKGSLIATNVDVTKEYFKTPDDYQKLFYFFNSRKSVNLTQFLNYCKKEFKINTKNYKWNFSEDEELKGNETRTSFVIRFKRCGFAEFNTFLSLKNEIKLWHYLYSVSYKERTANDKKSLKIFFTNYFKEIQIGKGVFEKLVNDFANYPQFPSRYCAYSYKALNKLLPFIRMGNNRFSGQLPDEKAKNYQWKKSINERIHTIIKKLKTIDFDTNEVDFSEVIEKGDLRRNILPFPKGLFNAFRKFEKPEDFTSLNLTQASYLVYGRHSELNQAKYWKSPVQIREELHNELKHNSLNNPIAEKVLLEMMQVVAEIWETYGEKDKDNNYKKLFDRIHVEVGRELKQSVKEKKKTIENQSKNRKQNDRLRKILKEFLTQNPYNAKPNNKDHFERLKILEDAAYQKLRFSKDKKYKTEIENILKDPVISKQNFDKYKLWIEQGYKSPYTNEIIKLSDLFDGDKYNIDHIFPQAFITNDSLINKVVCEREVNKDKSDNTGRAYILSANQKEIYCTAHNKKIKVVDDDTYVSIVNQQFSDKKREILLSKEIPNKFISAQLNTSRHIARKAMELLSHIVREEGEVEYRSKNVLPVTGAVTNTLKRAWKLDQVWKELVAPRFIRMNDLTQSNIFGNWKNIKDGNIIENKDNIKKKDNYFDCKIDDVLLEQMTDFDIKRIDHRHHALDALTVALCTEEHVNYINNINANSTSDDYGKQKQLEKYRLTLKKKIKFSKPNPTKENPKNKDWFYMLPGEFKQKETEDSSEKTVEKMNYQYLDDESFGGDYKQMILTSLQNTIVTFKQNKRVINKTINKYQKWNKNKPTIVIQKPKTLKEAKGSKNKFNWIVRRSLGKASYYGRVNLKRVEVKKLISSLNDIYKNPAIIVDEKTKKQIKSIIEASKNINNFKNKIKAEFDKPDKIELYYFTDDTKDKKKVAKREELSDKFNTSKIKEITDTGIQKILLNHLKQFDTVELSFSEAIQFYDALLEKEEFEAIIKDRENRFNNKSDFIEYLKDNDYKFKKNNYSKLNVFIEQVNSVVLRDESKYGKITEHPEIAFTPEAIDEMNDTENLKHLNEGKKHAPIKKVRIITGYGKQRQLTTDKNAKHPVKLKQYVVNDGSSNLFLGVYEREHIDGNGKIIKERKFKDIGLIELIETLKQDTTKRENPLPNKIYDYKQNVYNLIFTLSPLDLVYVPTDEEIKGGVKVDTKNLSKKQKERIYKYVDGGKSKQGSYYANFVPHYVSSEIWRFHGKKRDEIFEALKNENKIEFNDKSELIQNEFGLGSQQDKNQNTLDNNTQIKKVCWKLKVNRLGKIEKESFR